MATNLGEFVPHVGGPTHAQCLIEVLEALCGTEEITARTAAASSTSKIISKLNVGLTDQVNDFFEMFKRMANEEAGEIFYSRVSSCFIVSELYKVMNEDMRPGLREMYTRLVIDELPMVRRAAAQAFISVATAAETEVVVDEYLQVIKSFATDEFPTVRVIGTENLLPYLKLLQNLGTEDSKTAASDLVSIVKTAVEDPSWRIRLAISKDFGSFATVLSPEDVSSEIFSLALRLVHDQEPDVRSNSMKGLIQFMDVVSHEQFLGELNAIALHLIEDPYLTARELLAELCVDVVAKAGSENGLSGGIYEAILKLIADEDPLVRLRIVKKIPLIVTEIPQLCTNLTEHFKGMFLDTNWRMREELALVMPDVLTHMGQEYFQEHFMTLFLSLLKDGVGDVRVSTGVALPKLTTAQNASWVHEKLFPAVRDLAADEYLVRISMICALEGLLKAEIPERFRAEVLALLVNAAKDTVPNIRLRAAQALGAASKVVGEDLVSGHIRPILTELMADKDKDVQYFATESIKACA